MEKDHRGFTHQTIQETSPWVEEEKRNNNCVHSEGLRFAIKNRRTEGEIISEGFLTLFKEVLIISPLCSAVREATKASSCEKNMIKEDEG